MPITSFNQWSVTPALNIDLNGIPISDDTVISQVDDLFREMMAQLKGGAVGLVGDEDIAGLKRFTGGTVQIGDTAGDYARLDYLGRLAKNGGTFYDLLTAEKDLETIADDTVSGVASWSKTDLGAYHTLIMTFYVSPSVNGSNLVLRTSTNNGASYDAGASDYSDAYIWQEATLVSGGGDGSSIVPAVNVGAPGAPNFGAASGVIELTQFNKAFDAYFISSSGIRNGSGLASLLMRGGYRTSNTARNAIQLSFDSGSIASGHFVLQGIRG